MKFAGGARSTNSSGIGNGIVSSDQEMRLTCTTEILEILLNHLDRGY